MWGEPRRGGLPSPTSPLPPSYLSLLYSTPALLTRSRSRLHRIQDLIKNYYLSVLYLLTICLRFYSICPPALLTRSRSRFYPIKEVFQFCSRSVLYLFQNLFKICSRNTRSWSRLAVSAPTVEVWAILVLYSETRRSKVTSLSYFWAFICLDWKPAGCSVAFCA